MTWPSASWTSLRPVARLLRLPHLRRRLGGPAGLEPRRLSLRPQRHGPATCYELGISVHDDDSDSYDTLELETRADIASGQSGGPLWGRWTNGGRQIVGTLSGREDNFLEEKNSLFAGGNGLSRLCRWGARTGADPPAT